MEAVYIAVFLLISLIQCIVIRKRSYYGRKDKKWLSYVLAVLTNGWYLAISLITNPELVSFICQFLAIGLLFIMADEDLRGKMINDINTYIFITIGIISAFLQFGGKCWINIVVAVFVFLVLLLISKKKNEIGMADVQIIPAIALFFAVFSWMEIIIMALVIALITGVVLIIFRKSSLKYEMPFMPFLLAGVLIELTLTAV